MNFPFPDAAQRSVIWSRVFPSQTPTQGLDHYKLAQLNVAGGNIRNIALNAAFLAAESGTPVGMSHVLQAAKLEALKIERPLSDAEILEVGVSRVQVTIDHLVLKGFDPAGPEGVLVEGLQGEKLSRLLADPAVRAAWARVAPHAGFAPGTNAAGTGDFGSGGNLEAEIGAGNWPGG